MFVTSRDITRVKRDVYLACQTGQYVTLQNEAMGFDDLILSAFPVQYTPFPRSITERVTWTDDCDIICHVAKKEVDDLVLTIAGLRRFDKIVVAKIAYDIQHIAYFGAIGDDYAYILIGGAKK